MKKVKVSRILDDGTIELDFGPNWSYLLTPKMSKEFKGMYLKVGDELEVKFKKR